MTNALEFVMLALASTYAAAGLLLFALLGGALAWALVAGVIAGQAPRLRDGWRFRAAVGLACFAGILLASPEALREDTLATLGGAAFFAVLVAQVAGALRHR